MKNNNKLLDILLNTNFKMQMNICAPERIIIQSR